MQAGTQLLAWSVCGSMTALHALLQGIPRHKDCVLMLPSNCVGGHQEE